jgi:magnesium-transporting ATPase (P-type)
MDMTFFWTTVSVVVLVVDLWAMASIWRTPQSAGTKIGWTIVLLVLPVIGLVIWGIAGPRGVAEPPSSEEHSKG